MKEKILNYIKDELSLENVGFIKCRKFEELKEAFEERKKLKVENEFEEEDIEKRINPFNYMEEGKTIISIAFPYNTFEKSYENGFSIYTKGEDYHKVVGKYLDLISKFINNLGGKTISLVDSNSLPERYIAYIAGVGTIGKNNMLITKKYGSYVFLGEIITDLEIYDDDFGDLKSLLEYKKCGECEICLKECPTKSINNYRRNSNICLSYLTQKKDLEDKEINLLNGRVFGCDSCQIKCPLNENIYKTFIEEFKMKDFMKKDNEELIFKINNSSFKETFKETSCGWRGKNILIRNELIRKINFKKEKLESFKSESPYINSYIDRLLK